MPSFNDVTFVTLNGGLGRTLAGDDSISAFVFHEDLRPDGAGDVLVLNSMQDVLGAGFNADDNSAPALYHLTQFFAQVAATVYVTFNSGDVTEYVGNIDRLQSFADGAIKQVAVVSIDAFALTTLTTLQSAANAQIDAHRGVSIVYSPATLGTYTLATLPALTTLNHSNVSVVLSTDARRDDSCLGATLGVIARAKVSESIGYIRQFNVVKNDEFDTVAFISGELNKSVSPTLMNALNDKGYVFLRKVTGIAGTFHSNSTTATPSTSDFHYIENTRTMEKAQRSLRVALLPEIMSNLTVVSGKITLSSIANFELLCQNRLDQMKNEGEISAYTLFIDPAQPILQTGKLNIQVGITPLGVARNIQVEIGFQL